MPNVTKIVISRTAKVNLGDYQNVDHHITMEADVDPAMDDVNEEREALGTLVERALLSSLLSGYIARGKREMTPKKVCRMFGLGLALGSLPEDMK